MTPKPTVFHDRTNFQYNEKKNNFLSIFQLILTQHWSALIRRKPPVISSETVLMSTGFLTHSETPDFYWKFTKKKKNRHNNIGFYV